MKLIIQLISIYRAIAMFIFILYFEMNSNIFNTILVTTAISSDLLDGYLAKKHHLTTVGGQLLDLFSDKYLNIIFGELFTNLK